MGEAKQDNVVPSSVHSTVFKESENLEGKCTKIEGYDFNHGVNYHQLLKSMITTGFQASNLGDAIQLTNQMLDWRLADEPVADDCNEQERDLGYRKSVTCKVFLGFTSNIISSGVRDIVRFLVQHHMVDVIVTTAGGIEEDLIKCHAPTYKGDFSLNGAYLRKKGLNRIGNLLVPNKNYCEFEDWIVPIFDQMLAEQKNENVLWSPSKMIARLGKEINDESSYLYWAYKNNIPVFCPALTDGSIGDMLYFHTFRNGSSGKMLSFHMFRNPGLIVDIMQDLRAIYGEAVHATPRKTGMIILGGNLPENHICNANMMRNGADYAVFINTAHEFGGEIGECTKAVKVHCDATIAFPLLVAETFAPRAYLKKYRLYRLRAYLCGHFRDKYILFLSFLIFCFVFWFFYFVFIV
ncbi:hypothetical protein PIB30_002181 [Stylosanthes scabra]|uniref:Deoxyhypusine synthase n=1 Tax=Stylosanthes scabra TaxID=79078 RepID=A0ABU6S2Q9_9FABA|nr:hypothetical protein [Stylosanthes scabra]